MLARYADLPAPVSLAAQAIRPAAISFASVSVTFDTKDGQQVAALSEFDLEVQSREILTLVGPSGCGKSTALRLAAGLLAPTAGKIKTDIDAKRRGFENIAVVFQRPTLLPWLDILANVLYPVRIARRRITAEDRERAMALLALVGLADMHARFPDELSGGMQQRAAICRSLVLDPKVLLMDEPFGALDALTREEIQLDLLRIHAETRKTILLVTHSISEAVLLSNRVAIMSARPGRLQEMLTIDIAYPRSRHTLAEPAFVDYSQRIRERIFDRKTAGAHT